MDPIPFVDLKTQIRALREEIDAALARVIDDSAFILGPDVQAFEEAFSAFCGTKHCVGISSGLEALRLILKSRGIGEGDEVIVQANTFIASALAVTAAGATPALVDAEPSYRQIDADAVAARVTKRTRAIMGVDLYGHPAEWDRLGEIAEKHDLLLLEDSCQAHGALYRERRCGSIGRAAAFSFYPGKNLGAFGDAGAVTTDDDEIAAFVRQARDYGQRAKYDHVVRGGTWRLDTIQAAVLRVKLARLDEWNRARRRVADLYAERLQDLPGVELPRVAPWATPVWHLYVILHPRRDALREALAREGISTGMHYPIPIHLQEAYADLGIVRGALPVAENLAGRLLSLPIFPEMTEAQVDRVADAIRRFGH